MARVNGTPITADEVNTAVVNYMSDHAMGPDTPQERQSEIRKAVLDGLIGTELLYQRAKALSIDVPPASIDDALARTRQEMGDAAYEAELKNRKIDAGGARELVRKNLTVQKLIQETILGSVTVSEPDISKFYNEHQQEMSMPESVEVSHILVRFAPNDDAAIKAAARNKADAALARVRGGEDFATVAKEASEDKQSAARGGSLGQVRRGRTVPAFEDVAFKLQPGQVSDVVESPFGFHVIKVTAKIPPRTLTLEESHDRIAQVLRGRASGEAVEKAVSDLRAAAKVEIY